MKPLKDRLLAALLFIVFIFFICLLKHKETHNTIAFPSLESAFDGGANLKTFTMEQDHLIRVMDEIQSRGVGQGLVEEMQWLEKGPINIGGRTRVVLIDQQDTTGNTVFAAGVSGGLWKTENFFDFRNM